MSLKRNELELLAPARDVAIGREAILHGADAVYIGGPAFGARTKADNTVSEIAALCEFAHRYNARIFATVNTILHDSELEAARKLIHELYDAGVDALIVQDMGILELDIPPIALHASTQCDIRTLEKAVFLSHVGFSQLVLARELTLTQIAKIRAAIREDVSLEFFVHGALCVAFSGNCYISEAHTGRSANRGSCSQECRLPYTLVDQNGAVVAFDKHLLSMKDNDQSANLRMLIDAGVRSFKIEGRYKDMSYVKNVTAHYRQLLDEILEERPAMASASHGRCTYTFTPDPSRTFNRSSTDYFANGRQGDIGAFDTPVHAGLAVARVTRIAHGKIEVQTLGEHDSLDAKEGDIVLSTSAKHPDDRHEVRSSKYVDPSSTKEINAQFANGDGLTYFNGRELQGLQVNVARCVDASNARSHWQLEPNAKTNELPGLKVGTLLHRNRDHAWEQTLAKHSSDRRIAVTMKFAETSDGFSLEINDGFGNSGRAQVVHAKEVAKDVLKAETTLRDNVSKLGNTLYSVARESIALDWRTPSFVPASVANALRRDAIAALDLARAQNFNRWTRFAETEPQVAYPSDSLTFLANVYNQAAREFYAKHDVKMIESAYEMHQEAGEVPLMVTKHCLRFAFNLCPKQAKGVQGVQGQIRAEPMTLISSGEKLTLKFDCKPCEMHVVGAMRPHILKSPPPSIASLPASGAPIKFFSKKTVTLD
ncbi:MAG: peptidase U32 family protein [Casimicrobium sp.]